ncbi:MAG: lipoxygenase family protein [Myxococcota bacterium]|nr:lipoxygenase family protein [Myxococcota bacterium]
MPITLPFRLPKDEREARRKRLEERRELYQFEDREPFTPIPLMKPLSASRPYHQKGLSTAIAVRHHVQQLHSLINRGLSLLNPVSHLDDKHRMQDGINQLSRLLLRDFDLDSEHVGPLEMVLETIFSLIDSEDDSPFSYSDLLFALFDLPPEDMLDDLMWTPSFPEADPNGYYINVRNNDLLDVRRMGREMRRKISQTGNLDSNNRFRSLDEVAKFFPEAELRGTTETGEPKAIPLSRSSFLLNDDAEFARQRISGVNPVVLQRLLAADASPDAGGISLPLSSWPELEASMGDFEAAMERVSGEPVSLSTALAQGRLFVADYPEILAAADGQDFSQPRIFTATVGLFYAHPKQGLQPIAIRLNSSDDACVYTPTESDKPDQSWRTAKVFFQVADLIHHEMVTHLLESHFILEGIAVATRRQLDREHPVAALLHAHLRGVMFNLMVGRRLLLTDKNGMVDLLFPLQKGQWLNVLQAGYRRWKAADLHAPSTFTRRGTDATSALGAYPYRDDGMLVWKALQAYVGEYLDIFYRDDSTCMSDPELSAWRTELVAVYSRPMPGEAPAAAAERAAGFDFDSRAGLKRLLTGILFTSGPRHAAVNFAQWDYMMFVGNTPASVYAQDSSSLAEAEAVLPNAEQIVNQMEVIQLLSGRQFGRLGHFPNDEFEAEKDISEKIQAVTQRFRERLSVVGKQIDARNEERPIPFPYLHPDKIPNSANV